MGHVISRANHSDILAGVHVKYRVGEKSKLLILSEHVNKTEKIGGM